MSKFSKPLTDLCLNGKTLVRKLTCHWGTPLNLLNIGVHGRYLRLAVQKLARWHEEKQGLIHYPRLLDGSHARDALP